MPSSSSSPTVYLWAALWVHFLAGTATAFSSPSGWLRSSATLVYSTSGSSKNEGMWTNPPMDLTRAQECAQAFGECSVEELYELKTALHQDRVRNIVLGSTLVGPTAPINPLLEESINQEMQLEEELALQMEMMQLQMPESTLFPPTNEAFMMEPPMGVGAAEMPSNTIDEESTVPFWSSSTTTTPTVGVASATAELSDMDIATLQIKTLVETNVVESVMWCAVLAIVAFAPNHFI